jgi:hypothetical protein
MEIQEEMHFWARVSSISIYTVFALSREFLLIRFDVCEHALKMRKMIFCIHICTDFRHLNYKYNLLLIEMNADTVDSKSF